MKLPTYKSISRECRKTTRMSCEIYTISNFLIRDVLMYTCTLVGHQKTQLTGGCHVKASYMYGIHVPYLLDYTPPSNKRPPPLRGLSYCAGFLSRTHAPPPPPPPCSEPYMYIRVRLLDRACAIRDIHACVCNVAHRYYISMRSSIILQQHHVKQHEKDIARRKRS